MGAAMFLLPLFEFMAWIGTYLPLLLLFPWASAASHGLLQPAGLLYRPRWTFQLWPPDAPAPTDAFRTLAAEVGTYEDR
jgi:hypothetical protein